MIHTRFDLESPSFTRTATPIPSTATQDMTSLATSDRLQNVIEYCIKVRKTRPHWHRVE